MTMNSGVPAWQFDDEFDGGEETCGRVMVNLYLYIRDQPPGRRLLVISRDPGAPIELRGGCVNKTVRHRRGRRVAEEEILLKAFAA